jgi:integrase
MDTSVNISLEKRRQKKDGTYPLVLRLGHNQSTTTILLKIDLLEKDWDSKNRIIRKTYKGVENVSRLNNLIKKRRTDAMDIILELQESGQLNSMSLAELRSKICQKKNETNPSFFAFADELIEELKKAHRIGTARSYKEVASVLKTYCNNKELPFIKINYDFLTKFETHHYSKGNTTNGLAVYMRTIRAIYNKAMKAGIVEKELYPFHDYKVKTVPTEKRALEWEMLKKIIDFDITPEHECYHARNYFLASYMMYGMNYSDMAFLKKEDINSGRIMYRRKKTSKLYDIKITSNLERILTLYMSQYPESAYVFPIIKREALPMQYKDIQWARKCYNKRLKTLAEKCGIEQNLTSYVSRHSFATQAMLQEVPLNAISSMLGHSSLKTTEIYLKSLPSNMLDDYNAMVLGG